MILAAAQPPKGLGIGLRSPIPAYPFIPEAAECRRYKIPITTFMLSKEPLLVRFVRRLIEVSQGRAFFASLDHLEETVFVDLIRNRQKKVR